MATKRTTHRSKSGSKLYAVRSKTGKFKDVQSYKRAHGQDVKRQAASQVRAYQVAAVGVPRRLSTRM